MSKDDFLEPVLVPYRDILRWASQNGVSFGNISDLGAVNRKRIEKGLPQFRLGGTEDTSPQQKPESDIAEHLPRKNEPMPRRSAIPKNLRGLTHALFDVLDDYRNSKATIDDVKIMCDVSGRISTLIHAEIKLQQSIEKSQDKPVKEQLKLLAGVIDE